MGLRTSSTAQGSLDLLFLLTPAMPCTASVTQMATAPVRQWLRSVLPIGCGHQQLRIVSSKGQNCDSAIVRQCGTAILRQQVLAKIRHPLRHCSGHIS